MLPEIVSPVPIMKLAPSCLSHILIRNSEPFLETPGCHSTPSTWGATDNHHQSAVLGGRVTYRQLKIFILPSAFSELSVYNPLLCMCAFFLITCFTPLPILIILSIIWRGMIWFHFPLSLPTTPQNGGGKKERKTHLSMI